MLSRVSFSKVHFIFNASPTLHPASWSHGLALLQINEIILHVSDL